ncbi:hypothetical protein BT96DRAFT_1003977 [Gymnopus androsaceus JB14]|uniref:Uncharacterized protein n=1 Tax=Gymnopus androsaceus JB14 TaxID=1447944 RepID=A0A6A4GTP6_9AGAR|nr:hypothetical protein BT96DRAFT_1003977 [Gymnopus androsaceus JB14]
MSHTHYISVLIRFASFLPILLLSFRLLSFPFLSSFSTSDRANRNGGVGKELLETTSRDEVVAYLVVGGIGVGVVGILDVLSGLLALADATFWALPGTSDYGGGFGLDRIVWSS